MRAKLHFLLIPWLLAAAPAFAQRDDEPPPRPPRATEIPTEGFWPTKLMVDRVLDRIIDEMAVQYEFDDEQVQLTRDVFHERIPAWMSENRAEIQTLMNQFFEAQLDDVPPEIDSVSIWAQRVYPLIEGFEGLMVDVTDDMHDFLTEDQSSLLEANMAAFHTGASLAKNKIGIWADGGFDPESEWIPPGRDREVRERAEREEMRAAMEESRQRALAEEGDPVARERLAEAEARAASQPTASQPSDEWTQYTMAFIERYKFNPEQRQKALEYLRAAHDSRTRYLRSRNADLARVTKLLEDAEDEDTRRAALAEYEKLDEPLQRRFQQLKDRLDTLPTRQQRRDAAQAESQQAHAADDASTSQSSSDATADEP